MYTPSISGSYFTHRCDAHIRFVTYIVQVIAPGLTTASTYESIDGNRRSLTVTSVRRIGQVQSSYVRREGTVAVPIESSI